MTIGDPLIIKSNFRIHFNAGGAAGDHPFSVFDATLRHKGQKEVHLRAPRNPSRYLSVLIIKYVVFRTRCREEFTPDISI